MSVRVSAAFLIGELNPGTSWLSWIYPLTSSINSVPLVRSPVNICGRLPIIVGPSAGARTGPATSLSFLGGSLSGGPSPGGLSGVFSIHTTWVAVTGGSGCIGAIGVNLMRWLTCCVSSLRSSLSDVSSSSYAAGESS